MKTVSIKSIEGLWLQLEKDYDTYKCEAVECRMGQRALERLILKALGGDELDEFFQRIRTME